MHDSFVGCNAIFHISKRHDLDGVLVFSALSDSDFETSLVAALSRIRRRIPEYYHINEEMYWTYDPNGNVVLPLYKSDHFAVCDRFGGISNKESLYNEAWVNARFTLSCSFSGNTCTICMEPDTIHLNE